MTEPEDRPAYIPRDGRAPLHVAIDQVTVALLQVQQLRRQLTETERFAAEFDRIEATLQEIGTLLASLREPSA